MNDIRGESREAARKARDDGIGRAVDHADRVHPSWADQAFDVLADYLTIGAIAAGAGFTSEDVRDHADRLALPEPPHLRAWGGVFQRAARGGLIVKSGVTEARAARVHCGIITVWQVANVR